MLALEEVQPAFGVSEEELQGLVQNGIIHYDESVEVIIRDSIISSKSVSLPLVLPPKAHTSHTPLFSPSAYQLPPHLEHSAKCPITRGTGADVDPNTSRVRAAPWPPWDGENGARSDDCAKFRIPVYQTDITGQDGWVFGTAKSGGYQ
jgi:hypothetical protein